MSRRKAVPRRIHAGGEAYMLRLRTDHAGLSRLLRKSTRSNRCYAPILKQPALFSSKRCDTCCSISTHSTTTRGPVVRAYPETHASPDSRDSAPGPPAPHRAPARRATGCGPRLRDDGSVVGATGRETGTGSAGYVRHTRNHMRREEALFYARSERVLKDADWQALATGESMSDPMTDLRRLAAEYPLLAASLARPVREIGGADDADRSSQPVHALRHGLEQLVEIYGELLHDALELAWSNFDSLRGIRSPSGLMRVVRPVYSRNRRFAAAASRSRHAGYGKPPALFSPRVGCAGRLDPAMPGPPFTGMHTLQTEPES